MEEDKNLIWQPKPWGIMQPHVSSHVKHDHMEKEDKKNQRGSYLTCWRQTNYMLAPCIVWRICKKKNCLFDDKSMKFYENIQAQ